MSNAPFPGGYQWDVDVGETAHIFTAIDKPGKIRVNAITEPFGVFVAWQLM